MDIDDSVTNVIPARFEHDRRIQDDQRDLHIPCRGRDFVTEPLSNPRKNHRLQRSQLFLLRKNDPPERSAVHFTLFIKHSPAPSLSRLIANLRLLQCLMPRLIAEDHPEWIRFADGSALRGIPAISKHAAGSALDGIPGSDAHLDEMDR